MHPCVLHSLPSPPPPSRYLAQHLLPSGYNIAVIDGGWYDGLPPNDTMSLDGFGRPVPRPDLFPSAARGAGFTVRAPDNTPSHACMYGCVQVLLQFRRIALHCNACMHCHAACPSLEGGCVQPCTEQCSAVPCHMQMQIPRAESVQSEACLRTHPYQSYFPRVCSPGV